MLEQTFKMYKTDWPNKHDDSLVEPVNDESLEVSIEVQEITNADISQISSSAH